MNSLVLRDWLWTTWDYLVQGGWVMIPMIIVSVTMWILILERTRTFSRLSGRDVDMIDALIAIEGDGAPPQHHGIRGVLIRRFIIDRQENPGDDLLYLEYLTESLCRSLRRGLPVISVLAAVAPLLGLLGTVLGMIQTFDVISVFGTSNAKAMAGGISVALITTQTGLLVAIPGLFISSSLSRRAARLENSLVGFSMFLRRILISGESPYPGPDTPPFLAMEAESS